jgi:hypothetical protein
MQDFFERTVFRSESGGSEYDPHTHTMYLHRHNSDRFGIVIYHESIHWVQFICYTFGGFINTLMHIRDEYAKRILSRYFWSKDKFRHPVRFSLPKNEAFFNPKFDHEGMKEKVWIEENIWPDQHFWRDALLCEKLFLQMSEHYEEGYKEVSSVQVLMQPEFLIPRIMQRINNWAVDTLSYRSTKTKVYLDFTNFGDHPKLSNFGKAKHAGIELDAKDILEGMPVAFEIYAFQMEPYAMQRMKEITNTSYARAIAIFLEIMGFSVQHDNVARMALMFLAIAEMSLNPPLPPFGVINKLELDWNKIYPPLRFIELCHIAKRVVGASGYMLDSNLTWILYWIATVKALYLSQGGTFSYLNKDIDVICLTKNRYLFWLLLQKKTQLCERYYAS